MVNGKELFGTFTLIVLILGAIVAQTVNANKETEAEIKELSNL